MVKRPNERTNDELMVFCHFGQRQYDRCRCNIMQNVNAYYYTCMYGWFLAGGGCMQSGVVQNISTFYANTIQFGPVTAANGLFLLLLLLSDLSF